MERIQHNIAQGSAEWLQLRLNFIGASEIGAIMGLSKTTKRSEVLRIKKTGIGKEFSDYVQRAILDKGHEVEAMARPIAENIIGDALYPMTFSKGQLLASCDGVDMMETTGFEHKQYNAEYFEMVSRGEMPEEHMPQVQQCLMVTGAEKWLFMVSDGTEQNAAHMWVYPDQDWFDRIQASADQFYRDLETYEPEPEYIPAKAEPVLALPALSIQVDGSISIQSNLDRFGERLKSFIQETNPKPETDQDFANLEQACKVLKEAEDALKQAESNALAQTASVDEMRRTVAFLAEMARSNRLTFEKLVKSEKENRKAAIVMSGRIEFESHVKAIQANLPVTLTVPIPDFAGLVKGKKTLSSMQDSVSTALANGKVEANRIADELRAKHTWYIENAGEYSFLFNDLQALIYKDTDSFQAVARNRIFAHQEQERIKAEQAAKAQAEREERIRREAEEKAKQEAAQREEQIRKEAEEAALLKLQQEKSKESIEKSKYSDAELLRECAPTAIDDKEPHNESISRQELQISRTEVIQLVAREYGISEADAETWLINEF